MNSAGPRFSNKDGTCYGVYSAANEEKEPYGLNNSKKYVWTSGYSSISGVMVGSQEEVPKIMALEVMFNFLTLRILLTQL
jgi:hypothetical protein